MVAVDAVMLQQGNQALVERGRQIRSNSSGFKILGKSITKPLDTISKGGMLRYVLSLPLNSIPLFGTAFFLVYNGRASIQILFALNASSFFQAPRLAQYSTRAISSSRIMIRPLGKNM